MGERARREENIKREQGKKERVRGIERKPRKSERIIEEKEEEEDKKERELKERERDHEVLFCPPPPSSLPPLSQKNTQLRFVQRN